MTCMAGKIPWIGATLLSVLLAFAAFDLRSPSGTSDALVVSCSAIGRELELCQQGIEAWSRKSGVPVRALPAPSSSADRLGFYLQLLAAESPDIDVFAIDTTWPGMIGDFFVDLKPRLDPSELAAHYPEFIRNNTVAGKLVALPWFMDAGLLYYRKDLLEAAGLPVPRTWDELAAAAHTVQLKAREQGNTTLWGYVFQGRAYEGLTCNALEWVASYGGGTVVSDEGRITIENPQAARALQTVASWIGTISPTGVLSYGEEETRGAFQSGHAVFMRNWPYAWKLAQATDSPVRDRVGVAPLPTGPRDLPGSRSASTLGGWSLGVSRFSRHADQAVALVRFLAGFEEQRRRAIEAGFQPTLRALYGDPAILREVPFLFRLAGVFESSIARPSRSTGARYNRVSSEFWETTHEILSGKVQAGEGLSKLAARLEKLRKGGKW